MQSKKRGLFGAPQIYSTPGIGDGIEARNADPAPGLGMRSPKQAPQADRAHGLRRIAGFLADALAGAAGQPGPYAAMMRQRQEQAAAQAEEQRKRSIGLQDYEAKKQIDARYQTQTPDAFERALMGAGIDPSSDQGRKLYQGRAEAMARDPNDEFVVVPIPGVGTYAGPRSGLGEAMSGGAVPTRPVGKLTPIMGGTGGDAGGGFRR